MSIFVAMLHPPGREVSESSLCDLVQPVAYASQQSPCCWVSGDFGVGALLIPRKLPTGPERQPVLAGGGRFVVTADARLDDRVTLAKELGIGRTGLAELSDTDLLARAFDRWGEGTCPHLLGDFAFLVYDRQERKVFAATDAVGVRRLFYARLHDGSHVFASEEACLLALPELRCTWDLTCVALWVSSVMPRERSLFRDITVVSCGKQLALADDRAHCRRWWSPAAAADRGHRRLDLAGAAEQYRDLVCTAVGGRTGTDADRIVVELSGGMDSSTIAAGATHYRHQGGPEPIAGSFLYPGYPTVDEGVWIRASRKQLGIRGEEFDGGDILGRDYPVRFAPRPEAPYALDSPLHETIINQATRLGAPIILTGYGGDELTTGDPRSALVARLRRGDITVATEAVRHARAKGRSVTATLWRRVCRPLAYAVLRSVLGTAALRLLPGSRGAGLVVPMDQIDPAAVARRLVTALDYPGTSMHQESVLRLMRFTTGLLALDAYRLNAYRSGIEVCAPFFDLRLLDFALSTPVDLWYRSGTHKWLPRQAMSQWLPGTVCWRPQKTLFDEAVISGLRNNASSIDKLAANRRGNRSDGGITRLLHPLVERATLSSIDAASPLAYFLLYWVSDR